MCGRAYRTNLIYRFSLLYDIKIILYTSYYATIIIITIIVLVKKDNTKGRGGQYENENDLLS